MPENPTMVKDIEHPEWPLRKTDEYYLLFHSARCSYHLAHPVSVIQAREMLWSALLRCTDGSCFVTVGKVAAQSGAPHITQKEVHDRFTKATGHHPGYISREERRGIKDPKTTRELATWYEQQKKKRKG